MYIITFYQAALVSAPPNAVITLFSQAGLAITAPYVTTNVGTSPNINACAASSFVYTITGLTSFTLFINVFSGSLYTNSGPSIVTFTRIG